MFTITRRFTTLVVLVIVASFLLGCGAKSPLNPSDNPVTPPANAEPRWSTVSQDCSVTPVPVKPTNTWDSDVIRFSNQAGLTYTSSWYVKDEAGNETLIGTPLTGTTQSAGVRVSSHGSGFAPSKVGSYTVIWRYKEELNGFSNTISSTCPMDVRN